MDIFAIESKVSKFHVLFTYSFFSQENMSGYGLSSLIPAMCVMTAGGIWFYLASKRNYIQDNLPKKAVNIPSPFLRKQNSS